MGKIHTHSPTPTHRERERKHIAYLDRCRRKNGSYGFMCNTSAGIDDSEKKIYHITLNLHEQSLLGKKSQSVFDER